MLESASYLGKIMQKKKKLGGSARLPPGGVCSEEEGSAHSGVSQHALRQTPPPWTESQTPVKTLPRPNFVAAGN